MKIFSVFFILFPTLALAQGNVSIKNNCLETKYSFFRQGKLEQEFISIFDKNGLIQNQKKTFSSQNTGNYSEEYAYKYDTKGNNKTITYSRNGEINKVIEKEFDTSGKILKESASTTLNKLSLSTSSANGLESMQIFYDKDGITETIREKNTFNANGVLLKKEVLSPNGNVLISDTKNYNNFDKLSQESHFDATDKVTTLTDYFYDTKGNLLSDKTLRNTVVFAETKHEYDLKNNLSKKIRFNGKGAIDYYFTYEYDALGNLLKENYFYNDQVISVRTFEYDTKGNKIKEIYFDRTGNVNMYKTWEYSCK